MLPPSSLNLLFCVAITTALLLLSATSIAGQEDEPANTAQVTQAYIEMRTAPGRGYPVFHIAERDESVTLLKQRTDWVKIANQRGITGWVHSDDIEALVDTNGVPINLGKQPLVSYPGRRWEAGMALGDFGGTDAISGHVGFHFTRNLAVEAELTENFGDFSSGRMGSINIVHQMFPDWRYSPYLSIGAGTRETSPRSTLVATEDRIDNFANVGAGVRLYFSRKFLLRLQYKHYVVMTERDDDEEIDEWKIGISAFF